MWIYFFMDVSFNWEIFGLSPRPNFRNGFFADPFADANKGSEDDVQDGLVHIRIQQRNGRKTLTTVQGLSSDYDLKKIVRACKKVGCWSVKFKGKFVNCECLPWAGICLQWNCDWAPGVRGSTSAARRPAREHLPVAHQVWPGETRST